MNDVETAFRILNVVGWGWVALYMARGAISAVFGTEARRGDPMRLACFVTAFVFLGFNLRWLFLPGNELALIGLLALSSADAILIWRLGVLYGRGPVI